jgi:hypothetical protein
VWWAMLWWLLQPMIITPEMPVTVTLTAGAGPVDLRYTSSGTEVITVTARSLADEAIDVTLEVLRDEQRVAFNDDHFALSDALADQDAALADLVLAPAGAYTIRVHSFSGAQSGDIEVTLESRPISVPCDQSPQIVELAAHSPFSCSLSLQVGQIVTLTARDTSGPLDPVLRLYDADGRLLAFNDDHAGFDLSLNVLDAQVAAFELPASCACVVQVSDFAGSAGRLELTIEIES